MSARPMFPGDDPASDEKLEAWLATMDRPAEGESDPETAPSRVPPVLGDAALVGLVGEFVRTVSPHTEADPAALAFDLLASFGSAVGPGAHAIADGARHPARLNVVLVGETSRARKGTARRWAERLMDSVDSGWAEHRVVGGLASGEGLIAAIRDGSDGDLRDRRLLVVEEEFARVLTVASREGSTVSPVIRQAWDSGNLRVMTRRDPLVASGAHVSVIGHVTEDELRRRLTDAEAANGFGNRFLFVSVRRSKRLPNGGDLSERDFSRITRLTRTALNEARKVDRTRRTAAAEELWARLYAAMAEDDPPGLLGAITARAEAQVLRLSVTYALMDGSSEIDVPHLEAAWAAWTYAADSARRIFGDASGDPIEDQLLLALRAAGDAGLTASEQRDLFARHVSSEDLERVRRSLEGRGLVESVSEPTNGRPRTVTRVVARKARKARKGSV